MVRDQKFDFSTVHVSLTTRIRFTSSIDNSDWMRNGDFAPSRFQAQLDAVNQICGYKTNQNVENTVGVISSSGDSCVYFLRFTPECVQDRIFGCLETICDSSLAAEDTFADHLLAIAFLLCRCEVVAALTSDLGKVLSSLHRIKLNGSLRLSESIQIAQVRIQVGIFEKDVSCLVSDTKFVSSNSSH